MSLLFSEDELGWKARVRYQEFSGEPQGGFQIALNHSLATSHSSPTFAYDLEDARLLLRQSGAEFHGVRHEYALDSLIRILLTVALLPKRGFLLHAASIVRNGRAYIFMGRSGAGKSTVSSLSPEGSVLTDEISLLRFDRGAWRAHGTPFWGEFRAAGQNQDYPVAGIYCLTQAGENRLVPMTVKEMLRAILPCVLFFSSDPQANDELLNILVEFAREIPCFRLHFLKDSSFWSVVQS
ncbi:MAG TPA: hypothetical protein VMJ93_15255 [Verrucomicrobiae bacterium]|nr:hypothetical protein [Verrucomicrobiae bacterium]